MSARWRTRVLGLGVGGVGGALAVLAACGGGGKGSAPPAAVDAGDPATFVDDLRQSSTCALDCDPKCAEASKPWTCPALAAWGTLPHAASCGGFDGGAYPAVVHGKCTVSAPSGQAVEPASAMSSPWVLPDGRRIDPLGTEWVFDDFPGGFPSGATLVPGQPWLLVVDTGYTTHSVRAVSTAALATAGQNPVASSIPYAPPAALNWGLAYVPSAKILYVASGYEAQSDPAAKVYAYDFDPSSGKLTADAAKTLALPAGAFPQAVAVSADGKTLLVGQVNDSHVLVYALSSSSYGKMTGSIDVGSQDVFELRFDPDDATGHAAYATMWLSAPQLTNTSAMVLAKLDVGALTSQAITVGKEPEDMAFLDARFMVVADGLSDALSVVDRQAGTVVATVPLGAAGLEPTSLAYDAARSRLYATLASVNAVAVFDVDATQTPPALSPAGKLPTAWWPTAVTVDPSSGTLYVVNGRAHGTPGLNVDGDNGTYLRGSVQAITPPSGSALGAATATAEGDQNVQGYPGQPVVSCSGAPYDFPVPSTTGAASAAIRHVVFVERENKTFDALFGDLPGVNGDASMILSPQYQASIWQNARKWAQTFAHMDNYYTDAEQSIQGHYWDVFGRTSDVDERRWVVTWGRGEFGATQSPGVIDQSAPLEGSIFSQLIAAHHTVDNDGELVGGLAYRNSSWPGGSSSSTVPDTNGACYAAARARVTCDQPDFTYAWFGNDHTFGMSPGYPNPAIMMAVNDEATGMLLDGISHSPEWASTLVVVIEDDPSTGQDHVDMHRSIALFASPWIRRGYVSHGHYDVASVHKLIDQILGVPYPNTQVASAALPLDLFTSTPDYTPFDYVPRTYSDLSCNKSGSKAADQARGWDFRNPDQQPGLGAQVRAYLRGLR